MKRGKILAVSTHRMGPTDVLVGTVELDNGLDFTAADLGKVVRVYDANEQPPELDVVEQLDKLAMRITIDKITLGDDPSARPFGAGPQSPIVGLRVSVQRRGWSGPEMIHFTPRPAAPLFNEEFVPRSELERAMGRVREVEDELRDRSHGDSRTRADLQRQINQAVERGEQHKITIAELREHMTTVLSVEELINRVRSTYADLEARAKVAEGRALDAETCCAACPAFQEGHATDVYHRCTRHRGHQGPHIFSCAP